MEAAKILRDQKVDRSFDPRPAGEVLISMIEEGYLPGELLGRHVEVASVNTEDNQEIAV